jgi:hypothetical protein
VNVVSEEMIGVRGSATSLRNGCDLPKIKDSCQDFGTLIRRAETFVELPFLLTMLFIPFRHLLLIHLLKFAPRGRTWKRI